MLASHLAVGAAEFAIGIYVLPILIAPTPPGESEILKLAEEAVY